MTKKNALNASTQAQTRLGPRLLQLQHCLLHLWKIVCEPLSTELRLAPAKLREHLRAVIVSAFHVLTMTNLHRYFRNMAVTAPAQMGVLAGANAQMHVHTRSRSRIPQGAFAHPAQVHK